MIQPADILEIKQKTFKVTGRQTKARVIAEYTKKIH